MAQGEAGEKGGWLVSVLHARTHRHQSDLTVTRRELKKVDWKRVFETVSEHELERIGKIMRSVYYKRHKSNHRNFRKYGNLRKGFNDVEMAKFFSVIKDEKHKLLFEFQAYLGLRIGEAVRVNINDLNFKEGVIRIDSEKSGRIDYLPIPEPLKTSVLAYLSRYEQAVKQNGGWLFFAKDKRSSTGHYCVGYASVLFGRYRKKAGLEESYAKSDDKQPRDLRRLSSHSFRHALLTKLYNQSKDIALVARIARHTKLASSQAYVHKTQDEIRATLNHVFAKPRVCEVAKT